MISFPESAFDPLQPFEAVQEVAFVEVQLKVEVALPAPGVTVIGFAVSVSVGSCGGGFVPHRLGSTSGFLRRVPSAS